MTTPLVCPICRAGPLHRGEGKLEQSGDSFLPTVAWRCALCEYTVFEPAPHARWRPEHTASEPTAESTAESMRRRAA